MKRKLALNQVWVARKRKSRIKTRTPTRRIVAITSKKICYSTEGPAPRFCSPHAFELWILAYGSSLARPGVKRTLTLHPSTPK